MIELSYERAAMHGDPMPSGLEYPDQVMYQALSLLYGRYRLRAISREQAQKEKRDLIRGHEINKYRWGLGGHWADILKATELACSAYQKNRTLDNADKLVRVLEGVLPHG